MKYYNSIYNCSIHAFNEVLDKQNLKAIHLNGKYNEKEALKSWKNIMKEFIDVFGIPVNYKQYLRKQIQAIKLYDKSIKTGNRSLVTLAQLREKEGELEIKSIDSEPFLKNLARISKYMGFKINPKETTVAEFYGYIELQKDGE